MKNLAMYHLIKRLKNGLDKKKCKNYTKKKEKKKVLNKILIFLELNQFGRQIRELDKVVAVLPNGSALVSHLATRKS